MRRFYQFAALGVVVFVGFSAVAAPWAPAPRPDPVVPSGYTPDRAVAVFALPTPEGVIASCYVNRVSSTRFYPAPQPLQQPDVDAPVVPARPQLQLATATRHDVIKLTVDSADSSARISKVGARAVARPYSDPVYTGDPVITDVQVKNSLSSKTIAAKRVEYSVKAGEVVYLTYSLDFSPKPGLRVGYFVEVYATTDEKAVSEFLNSFQYLVLPAGQYQMEQQEFPYYSAPPA